MERYLILGKAQRLALIVVHLIFTAHSFEEAAISIKLFHMIVISTVQNIILDTEGHLFDCSEITYEIIMFLSPVRACEGIGQSY